MMKLPELVEYAKRLVEQAERLKKTSRIDMESVEPPPPFHGFAPDPGEDIGYELSDAVQGLLKRVEVVIDKRGFQRVRPDGRLVESYATQDLDEVIAPVKDWFAKQ